MTAAVGLDDGEPWAAVIETHTAALYFAGDRVYKVKKPVDLGFVDFTHASARRVACEREVALNRRLAPDVYLGVAELTDPLRQHSEPVVVMRRMPSRRRLATLVTEGAPDVTDGVVAVARLLVDFHARCAIDRDPDSPGSGRAVAELWRTGLAELQHDADTCVDPVTTARSGRLSARYLAGRDILFAERLAAGRVRDGHGDLLADDIFLLPDGPRVLDCLEFDPRLRVGDVLADVAFLAMDLERLGAPALARQFLDAYREFSAESHPHSLEHFFIAYRAHVRAKVACIRAAQGDRGSQEPARALAALSLRHLYDATVRLVLVGGLPGAGKTTIAAGLADRSAWIHLNSDVIRKELAGLPATRQHPGTYDEGLYAPATTERAYATMLARAETALRRGESVVLDASWHDPELRARAAGLAREVNAVLIEIEAVASDEVAAARLHNRRVGPSDADIGVRVSMAAQFAAWPRSTRVVTDDPSYDTVAATVEAVRTATIAAADGTAH